jgi:hypothetical protein
VQIHKSFSNQIKTNQLKPIQIKSSHEVIFNNIAYDAMPKEIGEERTRGERQGAERRRKRQRA